MTRTTGTGRFTPGVVDAIDEPAGGFTPDEPPFIWITGGDIPADGDPAVIGMDRILNGLTAAGHTILQANAPYYLGNDLSMSRVNDAIAYARANFGATDDPPILMGVSNGWACMIVYARQFPITGIIGILTVAAGRDGYIDDPQGTGGGLRAAIENAWDVTYPTMPPDRFSPYDDRLNYPNLIGKVQAWYAGNDPLYVMQQMSFLQSPPIFAEMHNLGSTGHLGTFTDATVPADHVDLPRLIAFSEERMLAVRSDPVPLVPDQSSAQAGADLQVTTPKQIEGTSAATSDATCTAQTPGNPVHLDLSCSASSGASGTVKVRILLDVSSGAVGSGALVASVPAVLAPSAAAAATATATVGAILYWSAPAVSSATALVTIQPYLLLSPSVCTASATLRMTDRPFLLGWWM